jgi:hypothetical protein
MDTSFILSLLTVHKNQTPMTTINIKEMRLKDLKKKVRYITEERQILNKKN